jgi:ribosomal protein L16/L10AE
MRFTIKNKETTSFKKRYKKRFNKTSFIFGNTAIKILKDMKLEYNYIFNIKKILKKFFKFKKTKLKKVWIFLNKNFPITKKSKNSRMGKGKGKFLRYSSRISRNFFFLEFSGFNIKSLIHLETLIKYRLGSKLCLVADYKMKVNKNFFQKNQNNFYYKFFNK